MGGDIWISPDGKVNKKIVILGQYGLKPTENCDCVIRITGCNLREESFRKSKVTIGECDSKFEHLLSDCLQTMHIGEVADVVFNLSECVTFTLELCQFRSKGFIFEWSAEEKYKLALNHKAKGVELFKDSYVDASYRFGKGLKMLASIPIDVENPPSKVDGVELKEIRLLQANLYNNLASCYLKNKNFKTVIELCEYVLLIDERNLKANYKIGIAYFEICDYEKSQEHFLKVIEIEPRNRAVLDKLKIVSSKLSEANAEFNTIVKKMFIKV